MALTDEDVQKIVLALKAESHSLDCRFKDISPEDLRSSVDFYKNLNRILTESSSAFRNTLIGILVVGLATLIWFGFIVKLTLNGGK